MDCGGEPAGVDMSALTTSHGISMVHTPGECEFQHYQGGSSMSLWFELQPHTPYLVTRILFLFDASRVVDIIVSCILGKSLCLSFGGILFLFNASGTVLVTALVH